MKARRKGEAKRGTAKGWDSREPERARGEIEYVSTRGSYRMGSGKREPDKERDGGIGNETSLQPHQSQRQCTPVGSQVRVCMVLLNEILIQPLFTK